MSDLIRREDAIKVLKHHLDEDYLDGYVYLNELEALPSAEPELKWIPVTETLPWTDTNVLVTVLDDSGDTSWSYTSNGWLTPDGKYWVVDNEVCYGVIAWMPLSEPYRGDR